jgi:hypothetical protein
MEAVVMGIENKDKEDLSLGDQIPALRLVALFDPEELTRRKKSKHSGYAFEEVKEHLRSMEEAT